MFGRAVWFGLRVSLMALLGLMIVASCESGGEAKTEVDESHLRTVTDQNFSELAGGEKPLVADFWASWCGPCRRMAPVYAGVAKELGDKAVFGKLNVDENKETAGRVGVQGIPCIVVFRDGKEIGRSVGYKSREALISFLTTTLEKDGARN